MKSAKKKISELDEEDIKAIARGRFWKKTRFKLAIPTFGFLAAAYTIYYTGGYYRFVILFMFLTVASMLVHFFLVRNYQANFVKEWSKEIEEDK